MKLILLAALIRLSFFSVEILAQTSAAGAQTAILKPNKMNEFVLLVRVPVTYTSEQAKAVNPAWDIVLNKWKAAGVFVTSYIFPAGGSVLSGSDRLVNKESVVTDNLKLVSSIILRTGSLENAIELAKACPVLDYGGTVEVREIKSRPVSPAD